MKEILFLVIFTILVVSIAVYFISHQPTGLEQTSTDNVFRIWDESSIGTTAHTKSFTELKKRGYFKSKEQEEDEEKANTIFNKYK